MRTRTKSIQLLILSKKSDKKDKVKPRIKEYSKGTGYVREEHKFSSIPDKENEDKKYLNIEEKENLNDILNYAAERSDSHPVESIYSTVSKTNYNFQVNNELDESINKLLKSEEGEKNKKILELYAQLLNSDKNQLNDKTYLYLVEFFIKYLILRIRNGQLNYASYFLCQIDKLEIKIPRYILDLFLDSSIAQKVFEKPEE